MALDPETKAEFLRDFPAYEWKRDEYGQKTRTTDAELEFLRDIEDAAELERLDLDYELLRAIIDGFTATRPNMGEDDRIEFAAWIRLGFCAGKYYGHREGP